MTTPFGWKPQSFEGIWRFGAPCIRPLVALSPWLTVALLILMFHIIGGTLVSEKGALFDLPQTALADGEPTGPVALVIPVAHDTLVFFDDSRYMLGDAASVNALSEHLSETFSKANCKTMLTLADRRISTGDLMKFVSIARQSGVAKVLFAEKKQETED